MRKDVSDFLNERKDLKDFVRSQPQWYRSLTRNPHDLQALEVAALHYYKKTIPHHVERFTNGVQVASMMMNLFQSMKVQS